MKKLFTPIILSTILFSCRPEPVEPNTQTYVITDVNINGENYKKLEGIINENLSLDLNEKEQNIRNHQMVEQLADRLKNDKNDLEGWIKLYQSYKVLGKNKKALNMIEKDQPITWDDI